MGTQLRLEEAAENGSWDRIATAVHETVCMVLDSWLAPSRDKSIDDILRACMQEWEAATADRELEFSADYYFGQLEGVLMTLDELRVAEKRRSELLREAVKGGKKFSAVLEQLYTAGNRGMRHGELAVAVDSSPNSLTGIMKRVVDSGAVTVSRSGKNTHYMLSEAGRRYWEERNAPIKSDPEYETIKQFVHQIKEQTAQIIRNHKLLVEEAKLFQKASERLRAENEQLRRDSLCRDDTFRLMYQGDILPKMQLKQILYVDEECYAYVDAALQDEESRLSGRWKDIQYSERKATIPLQKLA